MSNLVLQSDKNGFHSRVLRALIGLFGTAYLFFGISDYLSAGEIHSEILMDLLLGIALLAGSLLKIQFGSGIRMELSEEGIKAIEQPSYIRTAYWKKITGITLTAFTVIIYYESGSRERFRLPFLNNNHYDSLKQQLAARSEEYGFRFEQAAWWKLY